MALSDFPAHFAESVAILLELTEKQCLDPAVWDLLTRAVVQGAVTGDVTLSTALPDDIKSVRLDAGGDVKLVLRQLVIQDSIFRLKEVCKCEMFFGIPASCTRHDLFISGIRLHKAPDAPLWY